MRTHTLASLTFLVAVGVVSACTDPPPTPETADGGTSDASTDAGCSTTGRGTITFVETGIPDGQHPSVHLLHLDDGLDTGTNALNPSVANMPAGTWQADATTVATPDPIVRTAYAPTVEPRQFCLAAGGTQTVNVSWGTTPIPTSNKLWMTNSQIGKGLVGFSSSALGATGTPAASTALDVPSIGRSIAFDKVGNLWALGATAADPAIQRFPAASLVPGATPEADIKLQLDPGCIPGFSQIAFNRYTELYVSSACGQKITRLKMADVLTSGSPTPNMILGGLNAPEGIAVDRSEGLLVADSGAKTLLRYDANRMTTSNNDPANLTITPKTAANGDLAPNYIAIAGDNSVWVSSFQGNTIYHLTFDEISGTGSRTIVPAIQITLAVDVLPEGLAIDESGALWLTLAQGKIGRLSAAQLTASTPEGEVTQPEIIVTSSDLAYTASLAFFPAPQAVPLYGSVSY